MLLRLRQFFWYPTWLYLEKFSKFLCMWWHQPCTYRKIRLQHKPTRYSQLLNYIRPSRSDMLSDAWRTNPIRSDIQDAKKISHQVMSIWKQPRCLRYQPIRVALAYSRSSECVECERNLGSLTPATWCRQPGVRTEGRAVFKSRKDLFLLISSSCAEESCLSNVASGQGPGPDPDSWNLSFYLMDLY